MKRILKWVLVLAVMLAMLCCASALAASSGTCGTNVNWSLSDGGTLTITGSGDMTDFSGFTSIPWYSNRSSIEAVRIGSGVTSIGNYSFCYCSNLWSVTISNSVTSIGDSAFESCTGLTSITIPDSVTSIGDCAFESCTGLTSITIPDSVTSIGERAFEDCSSLTRITIPDSVTRIGDGAFINCSGLTIIAIPDSVTRIGDRAFEGCFNLKSITIPDSVTSIGSDAFADCSNLTSITISDSVTSIGEYAFHNCSKLTSITIPGSVTSIGKYAFCNCSKLTSIMIPDSVIDIGNNAFSGCYSIESVIIGTCDSYVHEWANQQSFKDKIVVLNHKQPVVDEGVAPTCTETGLTAGSHCSYCGKVIVAQETVAKVAHTPVSDAAIPATCTETGLTAGSHCSVCGEVIVKQETVSALGHTLVSDAAIPATCTETGLTAGSHCSVCGEVIVAQETVAKVAHTPETIPAISATDTQPGLTEGSRCSVCGEILTTQQIVNPLKWGIEKTDAQITIIQYYGAKVSEMSIPDTLEGLPVRAIAAGAIPSAKCPTRVYIPSGVQSIAGTAFGKSVTVYCHEYSEADYWADEVGYSKVYVDNAAAGTFYIVSMPAAFTMELGDTRELGAAYWPVTGSEAVTITSSNPDVLEVSGQELTAKAVGKATVTMKVGGKTASVTVTVHAVASDFKLYLADQAPYSDRYADELYIITKKTNKLSIVDIEPAGAELSVTYASSNTAVATVDSNGLITAKRPGTCSITATSQTGLVRTCEVTVCYPVTSVAFDQTSYRIPFGESTEISVSAVTSGGTYTNQLVYLESDDDSVATADDVSFKISGLSIGTATVTATADSGVTATASVEVYCPNHHSVSMPEVPATCTEEGRTGGSYCPVCGAVFATSSVVPATGHSWGEASYTWTGVYSITAKRVCQNDADHIETETVAAEMQLVSPTETAAGSYSYVSSAFDNPAFSVQRKTGNIPALNTLNTLRMPAGTKSIGEEAFANSAFQAIIVPDSCLSVGSRAFAGCANLVYVKIPVDCTVAEDAFDGCQDVIIDFDGYIPPTPPPTPTPEPTPTPKPKQTISIYGSATVQVPETMYLSDNIYYDSESSLAIRYGKLNYTSYSSLKSALQSAYGTVEEFTLNGISMLGIAETTSSYSISGVAFMANGQAIMITFMFTDDEGGDLSAECINSIRLTTGNTPTPAPTATSAPTSTPAPTATPAPTSTPYTGNVQSVYGMTVSQASSFLNMSLVQRTVAGTVVYYGDGIIVKTSGGRINYIQITTSSRLTLFGVYPYISSTNAAIKLKSAGWSFSYQYGNSQFFVSSTYSGRCVEVHMNQSAADYIVYKQQ